MLFRQQSCRSISSNTNRKTYRKALPFPIRTYQNLCRICSISVGYLLSISFGSGLWGSSCCQSSSVIITPKSKTSEIAAQPAFRNESCEELAAFCCVPSFIFIHLPDILHRAQVAEWSTLPAFRTHSPPSTALSAKCMLPHCCRHVETGTFKVLPLGPV